MSALGLVVVFSIVWWLLFFMLLPVGIEPSRERVPGQDPGAPARPLLLRKVLVATAAAVLVTGLVHVAALQGWISFWSLLGTEPPAGAASG
jgi:predicted secreted protein